MRVDLHTHSILSPDGNITIDQYEKVLSSGELDCIAITDHGQVDFALKLQEKLGNDKVIVGEEIMTKQGEIIGLFLSKKVEPGQDINKAILAIKKQNGLVYVPHPFETVRSGVTLKTLDKIAGQVDIIEVNNGRAFFQNYSAKATEWAKSNSVATFSSSDAHRAGTLGKTFTEIEVVPNKENLVELSRQARHNYKKPSFLDIVAPKLNRLMKAITGNK